MVFSLFSEKKSEWSPPTWDLHSWFQPDAHGAGRKNNYFDFSACLDCFFRDKTVVPEDGMPYEITKLKKKKQVHQPSATNPPNTKITFVSEVVDVEPSAVLESGTCFFEGEEEVYAEERAAGDFQYDSEDESATVIARPALEIRNYFHEYEADDCCAEVGDEDDGRGVLLTLLNKEEGHEEGDRMSAATTTASEEEPEDSQEPLVSSASPLTPDCSYAPQEEEQDLVLVATADMKRDGEELVSPVMAVLETSARRGDQDQQTFLEFSFAFLFVGQSSSKTAEIFLFQHSSLKFDYTQWLDNNMSSHCFVALGDEGKLELVHRVCVVESALRLYSAVPILPYDTTLPGTNSKLRSLANPADETSTEKLFWWTCLCLKFLLDLPFVVSHNSYSISEITMQLSSFEHFAHVVQFVFMFLVRAVGVFILIHEYSK